MSPEKKRTRKCPPYASMYAAVEAENSLLRAKLARLETDLMAMADYANSLENLIKKGRKQ